ncbi:MAG: type II toxin-antitoxin system VapC family toxin [Anaerolineae bacterium]|nr:type II toxin-antitoxin system VapC family toxin [Anaerolineae bacterium]
MSQPWTAFTGTALYLDTMVPYALLRGLEPSAQELFARIEIGEIKAYTSVLTFDELAYRMLLASIRDQYDGSPLDQLRNHQVEMIAEFSPRLTPHLNRLCAFPNLFLVDVTASDLDIMNEGMCLYHLRPRDALHLAAMQKCDCLNLVSNDVDFDRVSKVCRYTL